jgi:uncharacterized protein YfaP (DUF2135 family)
MKKALLCILLLILIASAASAENPLVRITSPAGGWSSERIITVAGTVSDVKITRITLVINGSAQGVACSNGQFSSQQVMSPGENHISAIAQSADGVGSDSIIVYSQVPKKDLKVVLTWDTNETDVDLWLTDPNAEKCSYQHTQSKLGAQLDTDVTTGYGPETITLANAIKGNYLIEAHYYGSHGRAQTRCKVTVILYEGTNREERSEYDFILTRDGEVAKVAEILVKE